MSKDVSQAIEVQRVEVVRHGEKLTLPVGLEINDAIKLLQDRQKYEDTLGLVVEDFDVFPWDGALALDRVLRARFGWAPQEGATVRVACGVEKYVEVQWGEFTVPGVDARFVCDTQRKDGRLLFRLLCKVKNKHRHVVTELMGLVRAELKVSSVYRGQAIAVRFVDDDGDEIALPEPRFIDVESTDEHGAIYSKAVADAIETNLFTPIRRVRELEANGLKLQRSVLLGGPYGTGKTLAAAIAAKLAVEQGMTYIYVTRADELARAIAFGRQYQDPACLIFCEDIDRVLSGERNITIDQVLNLIDGVDTKQDRRMLVFTTNDLEAIEPAMLRPGRLDAVIEVTAPDAGAAWQLVKLYGRSALAPDVDAVAVGEALAGRIPAVIAEVVKRAKLTQLRMTPAGHLVGGITTAALLESAETMRRQLGLLDRRDPVPTALEEATAVLGAAFMGKKPADDRDVIRISRDRARAAS